MFENESIKGQINARRELVFLTLAGLFWGSMVLLNVLGISRFINLSQYIGISPNQPFQMVVAVGVLAYPVTFLCTDFISELYGKKRANWVVWIGLLLNLWTLIIIYLGGALDAPSELVNGQLPIQVTNGEARVPLGYSFYEMRFFTFGATFASMIAYLAAQLVDVQLFHYLKKRTNGKKLWLRNNGSTLVSQLVDSFAVILISHFYAHSLPITENKSLWVQIFILVMSSYLFKVVFALLDTIPFYYGVRFFRKYLQLPESGL